MDVSGKGEIMMEEEYELQHKINLLVSKDLGQEELIVSRKDLNDITILHNEFLKTMPERKSEDARQFNAQYHSIRGDQWNEKMEVK